MAEVDSKYYMLTVCQNPERASVAGVRERQCKPVDPEPIIQLRIWDESDPGHNYLCSPYYFMFCTLYHKTEDRPALTPASTALTGTLVSSLYRLKDVDNRDGGFFVFGDLYVKVEGEYRLRFTLFDMRNSQAVAIRSVVSTPFKVFFPKDFPGMTQSTLLSKSFAEQGVKLKIRKQRKIVQPQPFPPHPEEHPFNRDYSLAPSDPCAKQQRQSTDIWTPNFFNGNTRYTQQANPQTAMFYTPQFLPGQLDGQYHTVNSSANQPQFPY